MNSDERSVTSSVSRTRNSLMKKGSKASRSFRKLLKSPRRTAAKEDVFSAKLTSAETVATVSSDVSDVINKAASSGVAPRVRRKIEAPSVESEELPKETSAPLEVKSISDEIVEKRRSSGGETINSSVCDSQGSHQHADADMVQNSNQSHIEYSENSDKDAEKDEGKQTETDNVAENKKENLFVEKVTSQDEKHPGSETKNESKKEEDNYDKPDKNETREKDNQNHVFQSNAEVSQNVNENDEVSLDSYESKGKHANKDEKIGSGMDQEKTMQTPASSASSKKRTIFGWPMSLHLPFKKSMKFPTRFFMTMLIFPVLSTIPLLTRTKKPHVTHTTKP